MNCCGKKRAELAKASRTPPVVINEAPPAPPRQIPRIFEYTGVATFTVRGTVSGATYTFAQHGARVEVAYEDTFAMFGERDIRPVTG